MFGPRPPTCVFLLETRYATHNTVGRPGRILRAEQVESRQRLGGQDFAGKFSKSFRLFPLKPECDRDLVWKVLKEKEKKKRINVPTTDCPLARSHVIVTRK